MLYAFMHIIYLEIAAVHILKYYALIYCSAMTLRVLSDSLRVAYQYPSMSFFE